MNAADIAGGAGNAITLNQNLSHHQFQQHGGGAPKAGMARMAGRALTTGPTSAVAAEAGGAAAGAAGGAGLGEALLTGAMILGAPFGI